MNPQGTDIAGCPVRSNGKVVAIQSLPPLRFPAWRRGALGGKRRRRKRRRDQQIVAHVQIVHARGEIPAHCLRLEQGRGSVLGPASAGIDQDGLTKARASSPKPVGNPRRERLADDIRRTGRIADVEVDAADFRTESPEHPLRGADDAQHRRINVGETEIGAVGNA